MAYSTATEVKEKTLERAMSDAGWTDINLNSRIAESDAYIDSRIRKMGWKVPFTVIPPLINKLSILFSRHNTLRDIFQNTARSQAGKDIADKWKKDAEDILTMLADGKAILVDASGVVITKDFKEDMQVKINTEDAPRVFTMEREITQKVDSEYYDEKVVGTRP